MLAKYVTAETLKRVAAAYDEDRMLFVGTTNIDYGQTWVWNMSLIAKAGDLELYRKVLLASASFPIVFPPVEIEGHLFVDGAARSNLVVPGMMGTQEPNPPLHGPGNLYLIDNSKVTEPAAALVRALGPIAATTISVMMEQSMQTALTRSYFGTKILGYTFKVVGIPDDVNIGMTCSHSTQPRCVQLSTRGANSRYNAIRGRALHPTQAIFPSGLLKRC